MIPDSTMGNDDCHGGGYCTDVCGEPTTEFCTAMDCVSGTQFCHGETSSDPGEKD